jgi:predicted molibdopterin-dependent oxidoreductase YjgC
VNSVSRFERLAPGGHLVEVEFDGQKLQLEEGGNLAAELLAEKFASFRETQVSGSARGPFCMMGACFDCLVEIDGVTQQACMTQVSKGMIVKRMHGKTDDRP